MNMDTVIYYLYNSPASVFFRDAQWVIPTVQCIHIVALTVVFGSALVTDLRLAGILATDETPRTVVRRYLPWMWGALIVLLLSGTLLSVAEPDRVLANWAFWLKMGLVLTAFVLTLLFRRPILDPAFQLEHAGWSKLVKPFAWISLAMWVAVIFLGRWIAYV